MIERETNQTLFEEFVKYEIIGCKYDAFCIGVCIGKASVLNEHDAESLDQEYNSIRKHQLEDNW